MQGLHHFRELSQRFWVLKPRVWVDERRRVSLVGWCVRTWSGHGRRDVGGKCDGSTGSEALAFHPAFNNHHRLERLHQLPLLLGVRANANTTNHQAPMPLMGQYTILGPGVEEMSRPRVSKSKRTVANGKRAPRLG